MGLKETLGWALVLFFPNMLLGKCVWTMGMCKHLKVGSRIWLFILHNCTSVDGCVSLYGLYSALNWLDDIHCQLHFYTSWWSTSFLIIGLAMEQNSALAFCFLHGIILCVLCRMYYHWLYSPFLPYTDIWNFEFVLSLLWIFTLCKIVYCFVSFIRAYTLGHYYDQ